MIEIKHLAKKYQAAQPLKDINVTINDGDIISIIWPSGTGKSTLLRCINMLEHPTSGSIIVNGIDITDKKNRINPAKLKMGMVFQSFNLFPNMTVIENVIIPQLDILKRDRQSAYDKAMEVLHLVGMDGKAMQYPEVLSGGQKQRVAIARTLAMDPEIILFDEPTSALDPTMVQEVQSVIAGLAKLSKTMLIVTHEMRFAKEICNRVLFLENGMVYDDGTPEEIFDNPTKPNTRKFIKRLKVYETVIDSKEYDYATNMTDLARYCYKNQISHKNMHRIQSCFEELCLQVLLPRLEKPAISFYLEYDEANGKAYITTSYNGPNFNPMDSDNQLALMILKSAIKNEKHTCIEEQQYTNKFTFEIDCTNKNDD